MADETRRIGSNAARNFYSRVERTLEVVEADVKDILQRVSKLEGGTPQPPDSINQILQRIARLEEQGKETKADQGTTNSHLWDIVKYVLTAVLGGLIAMWAAPKAKP